MSWRDKLLLVLASCMVGCCGGVALATDSTSTLPRYQFKVGQELVYKLTSEEKLKWENDTGSEREREWRIYVTRQNSDGSWRLVVRSTVKLFKIPIEGDPILRLENDFLGYCNLHSDGSYALNPTLGYNFWFWFCPDEILFPLPRDVESLRNGWSGAAPSADGTFSFMTNARNGKALAFSGTRRDPGDASAKQTRTVTVDFDTARGRADKIVTEVDTRMGGNGKNAHILYTVELVEERFHDAEWLATFDAEAEAYFALSERFFRVHDGLSHTAKSRSACELALSGMRRSIVDARDRAPMHGEAYTMLLNIHDRLSKSARIRAEKYEQIYAMLPVDWVTTDFEDRQHRLVDYRGRVVLLDFWYRSCTHCILAFPKVKSLIEKYREAPVVVLGINNDREHEDARHVIAKYELRYPTLHGANVAKSYKITSWPTFLVIDQSGRVASIHTGNMPHLEDEISEVIDRLLSQPE